jgi:hypothetical protein
MALDAVYAAALTEFPPRPGTLTSDIALMNEAAMLSAIREAYPSGPIAGVDQVWFADTSIAGRPEFLDFTPDLRPV